MYALAPTAYILVAIRFEERDLMDAHDGYAEHRRNVPMLVPQLKGGRTGAAKEIESEQTGGLRPA